MGFDPEISEKNLLEVLNHICSLGPRWQGSEGETKVVDFIEKFLLDEARVQFVKEEFRYIGFKPENIGLTILGPSRRTIFCEPLAYSASMVVDGELIFIPEDKLGKENYSNKIILCDALKSYQAYPKASMADAAGFILGSRLSENLVRVGTTNYERKVGTIPGVSINSEDTMLLKEVSLRGGRVRLEVSALFPEEKGKNFIVRIRGDDKKPIVLICSHYDSMWLGPHAFDNASGTSSTLELIRSFRDSPYNLDFLICGAEELGFWGSRAFVDQHPKECSDIDLVVCLDGICSDLGPVEIGVSEELAPRIRELAKKNSFIVDQWSIPPRPNSDHVSFEALGKPIFWLTTMDPYYHTIKDIPDHISSKRLKIHTDFVAKVIMNLMDEPMAPIS